MMAGSCVAFARSIAQLGEDLQTHPPDGDDRRAAGLRAGLPAHPDQVASAARPRCAGCSGWRSQAGWRSFLRDQGRGGWHPLLLLWPLLRRKVAAPVLDKLGGRLRVAVSGGAPLPRRGGAHSSSGSGCRCCRATA